MKETLLIIGLLLLVALAFATPLFSQAPAPAKLPYQDTTLPLAQRVDDLIGRLTTAEKISLLMMDSPAIPRLSIPEYHWWNEALHGPMHSGTTCFPQAIGLGATWDDDLHFQVATCISDEARALNNEGQYGLTCWCPNINIVRDPRWGRGQETYGEDPFLTGRMGVAFVKGMQGNDPTYLKVIATPKHFAVHSGPEPMRHSFSADVSQHDIWDTYLPAFESCIVEGKADSIMSAYSAINGISCTANKWLLTDVLRTKWGFTGAVVTDVDSVSDITNGHHNADTPEAGAALALKAGVDLNSGTSFNNLPKALDEGLITTADIDSALREVLTARFRLGQFDPPAMVAYTKIPPSVLDSPEHDALCLRAARESMVLLKNDDHVLPLPKTLKTIAVIGPNADDVGMQYGNYNGTSTHPISVLDGIKKKLGTNTKVLYAKGCEIVEGIPGTPTIVPDTAFTTDGKTPGLKGEYFNNVQVTGTPVATRTDANVNFDWTGKWPVPELKPAGGDPPGTQPGHDYSVRWTGKITVPADGAYTLTSSEDDGVRLWIDGNQEINDWAIHPVQSSDANQQLAAGSTHDIHMEYFQAGGEAVVKLAWRRVPAATPAEEVSRTEQEALDAAKQADAVVMVMGISARFESEEDPSHSQPGFSGGDRTAIELPAGQQHLIHLLEPLDKPLVVVMMSGSAVALPGLKSTTAVLQAWYPGQHGDAVADVLFGDYNPAGRLPVTIYKATGDLPSFTDYNMMPGKDSSGRTYRYFTGTPLYAFGSGLSYTTFAYSKLQIDKSSITTKGTVKVSVQVKNTGVMDGDEVVELYLSYPNAAVPAPIRALKGFKRITLKVGETKTVTFTLTPFQLALVDDAGNRNVYPGEIDINVGGNQTDGLNGKLKVTGNATPADYAYQGPVVK